VHVNNQSEFFQILYNYGVSISTYKDYGVRVLWKETEAQHFSYSVSGLYDANGVGDKMRSVCAPLTHYAAANWRNGKCYI
jgi:hypothetical protein